MSEQRIDSLPTRIPGRKPLLGEFVFFLLALAWPFVAGTYGTGLITETLIFAIAAMSLDLLMGYSGLVSFGHAAFFGVGAYAVALGGMKLGLNPWLGVLLAIASSAITALFIGYFCVRVSGVAFIMLTLAFAQLLFSAAMKWRGISGGSDGIGGFARPEIAGVSLNEPIYMYFTCLLAFVLSLWLLRRIISSQFGHALIGLRENEPRMRALGYSTDRLKLCAFVISGAFAGLSGALYGIYNSFVSPDSLSFAQSGMFLLMVVLGGVGSLIGPAIGATIFLLMKQFVSSHTEHWLLIVGIVFICCVMFFRTGIYGFFKQWQDRRART